MPANLTESLAEYASCLRYETLPPAIVQRAKDCVLDYFSSAMAGYKINRSYSDILHGVLMQMGGASQSTVLFYGDEIPAPKAAFLNSVIGHGSDYDDGHRVAQGHAGVVTVPVALALAEAYGLGGKDIIASIVVGYDFFIRLASIAIPYHVARGFHTTGTMGTVAAAATAANILRLNKEQARHAIGLGCMQAAGLLEIVESNQMAKPFNPGKACENGILAALFAKAGAVAPIGAVEGKKGFVKAFMEHPDTSIAIENLNSEYKITTSCIKLYPVCRHAHGVVDMGREFYAAPSLRTEDVKAIRIEIYSPAINLTGAITVPHNTGEAKFSLRYNLAIAMRKGMFGLEHLDTESMLDDEIKRLIEVTDVIPDDTLEDRSKGIRGARVIWEFKDGSKLEKMVNLPKGEPETPHSQEDMLLKLQSCAQDILDKDKLDRLSDRISNLEMQNDIKQIMKLT